MSKLMFPDTLASTEWLAAHANDWNVIVFECTTYLEPFAHGFRACRETHFALLPGGGPPRPSTHFSRISLGFGDLAVYDASMSEWVRDDALPMGTGPALQNLDGAS